MMSCNIYMLWLKTYKVKSKAKPCIRINIKELDEVPSVKLLML